MYILGATHLGWYIVKTPLDEYLSKDGKFLNGTGWDGISDSINENTAYFNSKRHVIQIFKKNYPSCKLMDTVDKTQQTYIKGYICTPR